MRKTLIHLATLGSIMLILTASYATSISLHQQPSTSPPPAIITVNIYPNDPSSIQAAVDNASEGDIIHVSSGIYYETITIHKSLTLMGDDKNTTILDGAYHSDILTITADNVVLTGFTIRNSSGNINDTGIHINAPETTITHCIISRTKTGITIQNTGPVDIKHCIFHDNSQGIWSEHATDINITSCYFQRNAIGIYWNTSTHNQVYRSTFTSNGIASYATTTQQLCYTDCNFSDNSVNLGGVYLDRCSNISFHHCLFDHNGAGLTTHTSQDITLTHCLFTTHTHFGISLRDTSTNIHIHHCDIQDNLRYGLYIVDQSTCIIKESNIQRNMLYSVYTQQATCNAQHTFWGSTYGPHYLGIRGNNKISWFPRTIHYHPYVTSLIENTWKPLDLPPLTGTITLGFDGRIFPVNETDSDNDGIPNSWEDKWGFNPNHWDNHAALDPDNDSLSNIEEWYTADYNSNPFHKDIFLELDWMCSPKLDTRNKPNTQLITTIQEAFAAQNITLHVDMGDLDGGEQLPYNTNFSYVDLINLYWDYFLHNDLNNPRKRIFHYGIICDYGPDINFPFIGWGDLDAFLISASELEATVPFRTRDWLIAGACMHHLGHSLSLTADTYNGIDNSGTLYPFTLQWWQYRNYRSTLNYRYKYRLLDFSDGSHGPGDFNDWAHIDLSFFTHSTFTT